MLLHYLKIAWRNIWNDKFYSLINLIGLTVAFTVVFLFVHWIRFELSFEKDNPNADRIYQVQEAERREDGIHKNINFRTSHNEQLKDTYPAIEEAVSVYQERLSINIKGKEPSMVYWTSTQENFFKLFPMKVLAGSINTPGMIINEELANRIFGSPEKAIGGEVTFFKDYQPISAVIEVPKNSMIKVDAMSITKGGGFDFGGVHYILLKKNTPFTTELQLQMAQFLTLNSGSKNKLMFKPLKEVHLYTDDNTEKINNNAYYGNIKEIRLFIIVVLLLLTLAVINYVNTSTARAMSRAREVGVRKISGSKRQQLIVRFLTEAFIISFIAAFLAMDIAKVLHHSFERVMTNTFEFNIDGFTIALGLTMCLITTVLAGSYASFYLSALNPVQVLASGAAKAGSKNTLRKILLGIQFAIALGVLVCTWTVYRQLEYMLKKDLGFNKENIYYFDTGLMYGSEEFINELQSSPYVLNATIASGTPYNVTWGYGDVSWEGSSTGTNEITFAELACDHRFDDVFDLKLLQGEFIPPGLTWWQYSTEASTNIVINENFKELIGSNNPLGMTISYGNKGFKREGKIIGVVKDFYFRPMNYKISPLIICFDPEVSNRMYIRIDPKHEKEALAHINETYNKTKGDVYRPFILTPLETEYREMYKSETRLQKILGIFSLLSVVLSFMGIVSMVAFIIEKRTKEIGIRKINGAKRLDIVREFWCEFLLLIGIAAVPAIVVSVWLMNNWLQQYVYRPAFGWWIFVLVPLFIAGITALILLLQVQGIAKKNPVECLKSE